MGKQLNIEEQRSYTVTKVAIPIIIFALFLSLSYYAGSVYSKEKTLEKTQSVESLLGSDIPDIAKTNTTSPFAPRAVKFKAKDKEETYLSKALTVEGFFKEQDFSFDQDDKISPNLDSQITNKTTIRFIKVDKIAIEEDQPIPYDTAMISDDSIETDTQRVINPGQDGVLTIKYEAVYEDGELVGKKEIGQEVKHPPVTELIGIGTKIIPRTTVVDGQEITYCRKLTVYATNYDRTCAGCNEWTATGALLVKGVIAVDPRVIPLKTRLYVPNYGFGTALDTGGAIKGNRIDLGFDYIANWPGYLPSRWTEVYILCD